MAKKLISLDEAAQQLGVEPDELNDMRQRQEIYGYRDGSTWKFKPEDVERLARERAEAVDVSGSDSQDLGDIAVEADSSEDVVLLSEVELGDAPPGGSSTIIGKPGGPMAPEESDIKIFAENRPVGDSDVQLAEHADLPLSAASDLDLDLGSGIDLDSDLSSTAMPGADPDTTRVASDSELGLLKNTAQPPASAKPPEGPIQERAALDLGDDEELVLAGPGDSDITVKPGDSGISLVDPADSGLSLDAPLDLGGGDEAFEIAGGGDDLLGIGAEQDSAAIELKADDDFLLTPLEEVGDEESEDSGSQVIALDSDTAFEEIPAGTDSGGMGGLLEEDLIAPGPATESLSAGGLTAPAAALSTAGVPIITGREAPYSIWIVISLGICVLFVGLAGMMMFDLLRNMWSWNSTFSANSALMDMIFSILPGGS